MQAVFVKLLYRDEEYNVSFSASCGVLRFIAARGPNTALLIFKIVYIG